MATPRPRRSTPNKSKADFKRKYFPNGPSGRIASVHGESMETPNIAEEIVVKRRTLTRPWGEAADIDGTDQFRIKILTVKPGEALSLQFHLYRSEFWLVLEGAVKAQIENKVRQIFRGDGVSIPLGAKHRLSNPGIRPLKVLEVQTGEYFGEDDITRLEDNYGRVTDTESV